MERSTNATNAPSARFDAPFSGRPCVTSFARVGALAVVVVAVLVACAGCGGGGGGGGGGGASRGGGGSLRGYDVVLITLDTTRADRLGCYGRREARTPRLDALAASGTRFERATAQTPLTLPSHASILTGTYPTRHGVRTNGFYALPEAGVTLAEILGGVGYATAAAVAAVVLDRRFGLEQGFDAYDDDRTEMIRDTAVGDPSRRAPSVTRAALAAVDSLDLSEGRPLFLWAHYFDPHAPYDPPAEVAADFPATKSGRYDAEIAWMDRHVGELLDGLAERGRMDRTLVLAVGDHGEGFPGPHDEKTHGLLVYDDTMLVPLIVAAPGALPRGRVDGDLARQVDLMPTILDLLEIDAGAAAADLQGSSLADRLRGSNSSGAAGDPRASAGAADPADAAEAAELAGASYGETLAPWDSYGWSPLYHVRTRDWKLIRGPRVELYDLARDPAESEDVARDYPDRVAALAAVLDAVRTAPSDLVAAASGLAASPEEVRRLQALGYVAAAREPPPFDEMSELAHPTERMHLLARLDDASDRAASGDVEGALDELRSILAEDPANYDAAYRVATILAEKGDPAEAVEAAEELERLRPGLPHNTYLVARALARLGSHHRERRRIDAAEAAERRAVEAYEKVAGDGRLGTAPLVELADLHLRGRDRDAAAGVLERVLERDPASYDALLDLGLIRLEDGDPAAARELLERAIESAPSPDAEVPARKNLVDACRRTGDVAGARSQLEWFVRERPGTDDAARARAMLRTLGE